MKKKVFYVFVAVTFVAVAFVNVLNLRTVSSFNSLRLANIAALSDETGDGESSEWGCGGNPTFIPYETLRNVSCQIWGVNGSRLSCTGIEKKVCCDPSKQTVCQPLKL